MKKNYYRLFAIIMIFAVMLSVKSASSISYNKSTSNKNLIVEKEVESEWITYIIKPGDCLEKIARKHIVSTWMLREWNGLNNYSILRPGQEIKIKKLEYEFYEGKASWYGPGFHGQAMANGDIYNQNDILIAHRTYPLGLRVKITNLENGKSIIAPVLDRGPYVKDKNGNYTREVDLSSGAADYLETKAKGVVSVKIEPIDS